MWNSPIFLSSYKVKNRIVFPPLSTNWAEIDGAVNSRLLDFYREIALGGCGMITVAGTAISPEGKGSDRSLCLWNDQHLTGFSHLAEAIRGNDCLAGIQLMHVGGQGNPLFTGFQPVSPSGIPCEALGFASRPLTLDEIELIRRKFLASAKLAYRAGFQAVELHLAHGYLLHEFLAKRTNKRNDIYGGNAFNRLRLILEIIDGVKMSAPGMILGVRVSGRDFLKEGIGFSENSLFLPVLEDAGVDYFSVTAGVYDSSGAKQQALQQGEFFTFAREIKSIVHKPVMGVGKILVLEQAEFRLQNDFCDLVAIGRALLADSSLVRKTLEGESIDRCTECGECQYLKLGKSEVACPLREEQYV